MTRRGRKPLALKHIQHLEGSGHAKQRMTTLFQTLQGECSVVEACETTGLHESHFHALRHQWLQQSLQLLEPRTPGRRPKKISPETKRIEQLKHEKRELERQLTLAQARCEVAETLGASLPGSRKKGSSLS